MRCTYRVLVIRLRRREWDAPFRVREGSKSLGGGALGFLVSGINFSPCSSRLRDPGSALPKEQFARGKS